MGLESRHSSRDAAFGSGELAHPVLHLSNAITHRAKKRDGFVVFTQLLNYILYARRFRVN
jgi:hypothetical protein